MRWIGHEKGMGIGGWLTNYKRFNCIPEEKRMILTVGDYEHFEEYIGETDVEYIASLGFDHIRLGFDQIVVEESPFVLRERVMRLIDRFLDWCDKCKINVVLNMHKAIGNYCDVASPVSLFSDERLQERFIWIWRQFELRYANRKTIAFELLNEVVEDTSAWNGLWQKTLSEIRKLSADRVIVVGGGDWNSPIGLSSIDVVSDPNVVYTFHSYYPFSFTHQRGVLQSNCAYYNRKMPYPGDAERYVDAATAFGNPDSYIRGESRMNAKVLEKALRPVFDFQSKYSDKIVWCGEFGTIRHAELAWRENWMNDMIFILKNHDIPYCVWNYLSTPNDGNRFSLVDDDSRKMLSRRLKDISLGNVTTPKD